MNDLAGGFLAGADRVVKAFHLPKKTMMSLPPRQTANLLKIASEIVKSDDSDGREELELRTYDLDDENMDTDPVDSSALYEDADFVPKTMQQMAEDAAKRDKEEDVILKEASSISTSTTKSVGRATRSRSGALKSETISNPSPEASVTTRRGRSSFTRWKHASTKRKRRRRDLESDDEAETSHDDGGQEMDVEDDEESDEVGLSDDEEDDDEERHRGPRTLSSKRPRNGRTNNFNKRSSGKAKAKASAPLAISSPTMTGDAGTSRRTLRPRMSKTTAQIEQERQLEEAYKRAVAG